MSRQFKASFSDFRVVTYISAGFLVHDLQNTYVLHAACHAVSTVVDDTVAYSMIRQFITQRM